MQQTMTAVIFEKVGHAKVVQREIPKIQDPGDVLLRVEASAICGSDLHRLADPPAFTGIDGGILGHEMVGEVIEVGSAVTNVRVGQRVILDPNINCGQCFYCVSGMPNMCEHMLALGFSANGTFAEYAICPGKMMLPISKDVPLQRAVFAEPINCVYGALKKIKLLAGESVLILGGGPIGLLFVQMLKANGAGKIFVSETAPARKAFAEKVGATLAIDPTSENLEEVILANTDNRGVDVCVDAVGTLIADAVACTKKGGRVILFGQNFIRQQTFLQTDLVRKGLTVIGNNIGDYTLPMTVQLLESGLIAPEELITHEMPLSDFDKGLQLAREGTAMKVVFYP